MRLATIAAPVAAIVATVPAHAFACINSIARHFQTYPLDFAHVGVVMAVLILFRWPATMPTESAVDPEDLEAELLSAPVYSEPSSVRQLTILAVCVVAGIGYGFFRAKVVSFEITSLQLFGLFNVSLVAAAIGLSEFDRFPGLRRGMRRALLTLAGLLAVIGSVQAYDGYTSEPGNGFQPADPSLTSQVEFF